MGDDDDTCVEEGEAAPAKQWSEFSPGHLKQEIEEAWRSRQQGSRNVRRCHPDRGQQSDQRLSRDRPPFGHSLIGRQTTADGYADERT